MFCLLSTCVCVSCEIIFSCFVHVCNLYWRTDCTLSHVSHNLFYVVTVLTDVLSLPVARLGLRAIKVIYIFSKVIRFIRRTKLGGHISCTVRSVLTFSVFISNQNGCFFVLPCQFIHITFLYGSCGCWLEYMVRSVSWLKGWLNQGKFGFVKFWGFVLFIFDVGLDCQYHSHLISRKTWPWNDLLYVKWDAMLHSTTFNLTPVHPIPCQYVNVLVGSCIHCALWVFSRVSFLSLTSQLLLLIVVRYIQDVCLCN